MKVSAVTTIPHMTGAHGRCPRQKGGSGEGPAMQRVPHFYWEGQFIFRVLPQQENQAFQADGPVCDELREGQRVTALTRVQEGVDLEGPGGPTRNAGFSL